MENMIEITKPEELIIWNGVVKTGIHLSRDDAALLLGYMEGHAYCLGVEDGSLYRKDIAEPAGECVPYSLDEVIDLVCEWNYELLEDNEKEMQRAESQRDFENYQEMVAKLKKDEPQLNQMFAQTIYGKQVRGIAKQMIVDAGGVIPADMLEQEDSMEERQREENKEKDREEKVR